MDDMIRNRCALNQEIDSLKQTLSNQDREKESLLQTLNVFKKESKEKENKYIDKEIDLEKRIKELDNIVYKVGQSAQTKAQRIKPTLYDGSIISRKHDVISVVDEEETLILKEDDFGKLFVPQKELSAKQAFWLQLSNPISEQLVVQSTLVKTEVPSELPKSFIHEYNENLVLKAELAKKEHMVEKKFFDEVVLRCSRLENCYVNLELTLQHQKESFLNNKPLNNQNAPDIHVFFTKNEWQAKLDAKDVSIAKLKKHIESLKGKNVLENDAPTNKAKIIAPRMFKLDLELLAPKVLKNRDAHIDYIKHAREHADTLREIVEHARALRPLDNDLDSACPKVNLSHQICFVPKVYNLSHQSCSLSLHPMKTLRIAKVAFVPCDVELRLAPYVDMCVCNHNPYGVHELWKLAVMALQVVFQIGSRYMTPNAPIHMIGKPALILSTMCTNSSTVRFGNDQSEKIMSYGDYQMGNVTISRVYYVEGLGHNLFSVGQFCDSDLEVAFRKHSCYIRDLERMEPT
ncbi:hypothetical protein Tco_0448475 [Tanacetum coccineum]